MPPAEHLVASLVAVAILAAITAAVFWANRLPRPLAPVLAIGRGVLQLAVLAVVLGGLIRSWWGVALALAVMAGIAIWTAAGRLGGAHQIPIAATAMLSGVVVALTVVFATGALDTTPRYALAMAGIVIGSSMTSTTLAGRSFRQSSIDQWDQIEGWLAIGARPDQANVQVARTATYHALAPSIDQTRTTGLVTLPGAFVGAIFGGLSPLEAGRFQVLVLAAIMACSAIAATLTTRLLSRTALKPVELLA